MRASAEHGDLAQFGERSGVLGDVIGLGQPQVAGDQFDGGESVPMGRTDQVGGVRSPGSFPQNRNPIPTSPTGLHRRLAGHPSLTSLAALAQADCTSLRDRPEQRAPQAHPTGPPASTPGPRSRSWPLTCHAPHPSITATSEPAAHRANEGSETPQTGKEIHPRDSHRASRSPLGRVPDLARITVTLSGRRSTTTASSAPRRSCQTAAPDGAGTVAGWR